MEKPIPDLIYYQGVVDKGNPDPEILRSELQDLINEVKDYMGHLQSIEPKGHQPTTYSVADGLLLNVGC